MSIYETEDGAHTEAYDQLQIKLSPTFTKWRRKEFGLLMPRDHNQLADWLEQTYIAGAIAILEAQQEAMARAHNTMAAALRASAADLDEREGRDWAAWDSELRLGDGQ